MSKLLRSGRGVRADFGSAQDLRCEFRAENSGRQYSYEGRIRRVGLDLGVTGGGSPFVSRSCYSVFERSMSSGLSPKDEIRFASRKTRQNIKIESFTASMKR
ncbi:DUF992 domain-containing protein [Nitrobacter winogradskyi]|uniref:DUF992 domain-containing protein n=1 Tax=Nitrobacter winogradskyi TaxID=913 RepID=UPI001141A581|nr:DUF992 domain-containing protein [Nitrobacter winogradskyi]